jgi:sugar transferase (PEP-CTERM/EpsH1 system associated)
MNDPERVGSSTGRQAGERPPLIAHLVSRFDIGGLENGMVNLLNHMPRERYRHAVICLEDFTDFRNRIARQDVAFHALHKRPGKDLDHYRRLWRLLRELRPDLVHTRNLSALEGQFVAALAGVRVRVHGEHGRDVFDLHGTSWKYNVLRRCARPLVHRYIAVSRDLERWLIQTVGVASRQVAQIYNGVDTQRFHPLGVGPRSVGPAGFASASTILIGSIGRMAAVKDYPTLVRAFLMLTSAEPSLRARLRLVIVGDGPTRSQCLRLLRDGGAESLAWLPGERDDVPELMRGFDVFVLPSLGEGISNTILEAMATGLPVVATRVGGNPELVDDGETGALVPSGDVQALAAALRAHVRHLDRSRRLGAEARRRVEERFSIAAMVAGYLGVYDAALQRNAQTDRARGVDAASAPRSVGPRGSR